jgi:hypothetical protein
VLEPEERVAEEYANVDGGQGGAKWGGIFFHDRFAVKVQDAGDLPSVAN